MRLNAVLALVMVFLLCAAQAAWAHRVNIFAWVENNVVNVECRFSKTSPVRSGTVLVYDAATEAEVTRGTTDEQGLFSFPVPEQARAAGHGLRLIIKAGEGHQNDWIIEAAELAAAQPEPQSQAAASTSVGQENAAQPEGKAGAEQKTAAQPAPQADASTSTDQSAPAHAAPAPKAAENTQPAQAAHARTRAEAEAAAADPGIKEIALGIAALFALAGIVSLIRRRRV
jgi:nickel transport protein